MRSIPAVTLVTLLAALTVGCSEEVDSPAAATTPPAADTPTEEASEAVADDLEGTYRRTLTPATVRNALRPDGWGKRVERVFLRDLPADPEFQLDMQGGQFRVSRVADDDQYLSGSYTLENGEVTLDDEAPVGTLTFAYEPTGTGVRFRYVTNSLPEGVEWRPGIPDYVPALPLLAGSEWERVG